MDINDRIELALTFATCFLIPLAGYLLIQLLRERRKFLDVCARIEAKRPVRTQGVVGSVSKRPPMYITDD